MTPLETLAKYGLKTDVKSIRERMLKNDYFSIVYGSDVTTDRHVSSVKKEADNLRTADLSLLCSLAEKGERRSNPLNPNIKMTVQEAWAQVSDEAEPYVIYECLDTISKAIEKGERYEKAVKKELENAQSFIKFDGQKGQASAIEYLLKAIITEAEGK